jgi:hypothetical protein
MAAREAGLTEEPRIGNNDQRNWVSVAKAGVIIACRAGVGLRPWIVASSFVFNTILSIPILKSPGFSELPRSSSGKILPEGENDSMSQVDNKKTKKTQLKTVNKLFIFFS